MNDTTKMRPMAILKKYFGMQEEYKGETGLKGFSKEIKELVESDKNELVDFVTSVRKNTAHDRVDLDARNALDVALQILASIKENHKTILGAQ